MNHLNMAPENQPARTECIGIILVHGIGEQRRFEHLDGQLRFLIRALHGLKLDGDVDEVSVDIRPNPGAAFHAQSDSWNAGPEPTVTIVVRHALGGEELETRLQVHEVWWADVNEPYSLAKQFRFWLWGLAVWSRPDKTAAHLASSHEVEPPQVPGGRYLKLWDRIRLFGIGVFFTLLGYSIGTFTFLANRLLNWRTPDILQVLSNYVSGVKIYNQRRRYGPGLFWLREEFLDSVGEPPRVSVRRRMIRAIADVSCNRYDRWYVLAHSLGTVVAFNGLMETAYAWPGYLNEERWERLRFCSCVGNRPPPDSDDPVMPRRPAWLDDNEIVDRPAVFSRFAGFLTYGSPLEKFASMWPALVPISREAAFPTGVAWLNVYDPLDPVSGRLEAFKHQSPDRCPPAQDIGYAASWWLLLAHTKYLARRRDGNDLATPVVKWLLTNRTAYFPREAEGWRCGSWFAPIGRGPSSVMQPIRSIVAWVTWFAAAALLVGLGAVFLPMLLAAAGAAIRLVAKEIVALAPALANPAHSLAELVKPPIELIAALSAGFAMRCALLFAIAMALTVIVGTAARLFFFRRDDDDVKKGRLREPLARAAMRLTPHFLVGARRLNIVAAQQAGEQPPTQRLGLGRAVRKRWLGI